MQQGLMQGIMAMMLAATHRLHWVRSFIFREA
jgi:hypothetical protein